MLTEGLIAMLTDTANENPRFKLAVRDRKRNPKFLSLIRKASNRKEFSMKQNENSNGSNAPLSSNELEKVSGGYNPFEGKSFIPRYQCDNTSCSYVIMPDEDEDPEGMICPICQIGKMHQIS